MRLKAVAVCLFAFCVAAAGICQAPVPLQAELVKQLEAKHVAVGATVRAKVTVDWAGADCVLRRGALLEGTVEAVQPHKDSTPSTLALGFRRAQCGGKDLTPMNMVIVALAQAPSQMEAVPGVGFNSPAGPYGTGGGPVGAPPLSDMNTPKMQVGTSAHRFPAKAEIRNGDVFDIKGMKLSAGTGPNRSSVMTAERGDVYLRQFTQMLLVPESVMFGPGPAAPAATPSEPEAGPGAEPPVATPPGR